MKKQVKKWAALLIAAVMLTQFFAVSAFASKSVFVCDITMNGTVEAEDARLALRMAIGLENYTVAHKKLADADEDGVITPADARIILRVAVRLETGPRTMAYLSDADLSTFAYTGGKSTIGQNQSGDNPSGGNPSGVSVPAGTAPAMPTPSPVSGMFTFTVYGWGDGVGMSQYGAVGMSKAGYTYDQILKHYYTGVKLVTDNSYPSSTYYEDDYYDTEELLARIVYLEMYGITDDNVSAGTEALKAQTVAVFTLLKYYNFSVDRALSVGYASDRSYSSLPTELKNIVKSVIGQYLAVSTDSSSKAIESVYCAMAAGKTGSSKDIWGFDCSYLQAVNSPYEMSSKGWAYTFYFNKEQLRSIIMDYDSSIELSSDPSQWLKILSHTASIDANRGYVTKIQVGDRTLSGYSEFFCDMMGDYFWSTDYFCATTCMYVTYTP